MSCVPEVPLKQVRDRDLDTWKNTTYLAYSCCSLCKLTVAKGVPVWGTCTKRHNNGKSQQLKRNHVNFKYNVCSCFCLPLKQSVWHSQQKNLHRCTFQVSCMAWTVLRVKNQKMSSKCLRSSTQSGKQWQPIAQGSVCQSFPAAGIGGNFGWQVFR